MYCGTVQGSYVSIQSEHLSAKTNLARGKESKIRIITVLFSRLQFDLGFF